jgi:hypothetical protein
MTPSPESQIQLKAKDFFTSADGILHAPGDLFSLPEREALGYIGLGVADEASPAPAELQLKLRARDRFSDAAGTLHQPGDVFSLPEREALGYIGAGAADEVI